MEKGYTRVAALKGGMSAWGQVGGKIVTEPVGAPAR
jgi:hypothetical protein